MNPEGTSEVWQIELAGQIIDADFDGITKLIDRGELLRMDRVRNADIRWIEAGKLPELLSVFNAKDGDEPAKPVITLTKLGAPAASTNSTSKRIGKPPVVHFQEASATGPPILIGDPLCSTHANVRAAYMCGTCFSYFCKTCPTSYGGTVKICPFCGAMCESLAKMETEREQTVSYAAGGEGFGLSDFAQALAYPFKFRASLIMGAVMFMIFSIGQSATGFGGFFMIGSALTCYMLANTLTFGVLSNTVENFAQGKIGENFMPSFDEFSAWDDVIHPFFLSIGVWLVSFGPLFVLIIATLFFFAGAVKKEINAVQTNAAQTVVPDLPMAAKAADQSQAVRDLLKRSNENQQRRIEQIEREASEADETYQYQKQPASIAPEAEEYSRKSTLPVGAQNNTQPVNSGEMPAIDESEQAVMRANDLIRQTQKAQLESVVGKTPETKSDEQWAMIKHIIGYGAIFLLIGGICLLWGLLYFPAACAVAGYTHSFGATLNPAVGLDTIKRLGLDYVKILLMGLALVIMSGLVSGVFAIALSPFDMPGVGNIPASAFSSLFGFYFSVVFSCVLGFAMFKARDRLKLPS